MLRHASLIIAFALFVACDTSKKCDATNCSGCCSAEGECQAGSTNTACGSGGEECAVCGLGHTCQLGLCAPFTPGSGGGVGAMGGGSAVTGGGNGNTGGGDASGGGSGNTGGGTATGGGAGTGGGNQTCTSCPTGFSCVNGACAGGDLSALSLSVSTSKLTLDVLGNGQPFVSNTCFGSDWVTSVSLYTDPEATHLSAYGWIDTCAATDVTTSWWGTGITLTPRVAGAGVLSQGKYAAPDITLNGDTTRTIDLPIRTVSGHITSNGVAGACSNVFLGEIAFTDGATHIQGTIICSDGSPYYELKVPQGSWRVEVLGNADSPLPELPTTVSTNAVVGPATSTLDFNANFSNVALSVLLNGQTPPCTVSSDMMVVVIRSQGMDLTATPSLTCGQNFGATFRAAPGTYVAEINSYVTSGFPYGVFTRTMTISGATATLNVDAVRRGGTITINGAPLSGCASSDTVSYYPDGPGSVALPITCGAATTFDGWVPVGSYTELLQSMAAQVPSSTYYSRAVVVNGADTNVSLALNTFDVTLDALANGAAVSTNCDVDNRALTYKLTPSASGGAHAEMEVPCQAASTAQTVTLFAGTSTLQVLNGVETPFGSTERTVSISANGPLTTDSVTRRIDGTLRVNGSAACDPADTGLVYFENASGSLTSLGNVSCQSGLLRFVAWVAPGRWRVSVSGSGPTGLPVHETTVIDALQVP